MTKLVWISLLLALGGIISKYPRPSWKVAKVFFIIDSIFFWVLWILDDLGIIDFYTFI